MISIGAGETSLVIFESSVFFCGNFVLTGISKISKPCDVSLAIGA